jgi:hypothetical protein
MKIGRNDPCSCGSGLKYKKCCLPKEQDEKQIKIIGQREYYRQAFQTAQKKYREGKGPLGEYFDELEITPDPEYEEWFKRDEEEGRRNLEAYEAELRSQGAIQ